MPMMINLPCSYQSRDIPQYSLDAQGSYTESTGWNQPGDASSPQYGVEGSMMCLWRVIQGSGVWTTLKVFGRSQLADDVNLGYVKLSLGLKLS